MILRFPVRNRALEFVVPEWEKVSMGILAMKKKIGQVVEQHTPTHHTDTVGSEKITDADAEENKRYRVEWVDEVLPSGKKIPFRPDFRLRMTQKQGLNAKEDKNREIGQDCAEQCASVVMRFMRARKQRHVDERVGLCIHTVRATCEPFGVLSHSNIPVVLRQTQRGQPNQGLRDFYRLEISMGTLSHSLSTRLIARYSLA